MRAEGRLEKSLINLMPVLLILTWLVPQVWLGDVLTIYR